MAGEESHSPSWALSELLATSSLGAALVLSALSPAGFFGGVLGASGSVAEVSNAAKSADLPSGIDRGRRGDLIEQDAG